MEFPAATRLVREGEDPNRVANSLLAKLTEDEKLALLQGDPPFWQGLWDLYNDMYTKRPYSHGEIKRLGIPGIQYCDGPRGVNINQATVFPCSMARGATWDTSLEEQVGLAIGREARFNGANLVGSVCINLPRHPAWGRIQETYSEDPLLLGEFGAAHVRGLQKNVMACIKHYALNSMETARFRVDVSVDEAALHEAFLPHFRRCIDEGAMSIMTAYNSVNGEWAGENKVLINDILRDLWKFDGITITDWLFGMRDGVKSVEAGLDIEAPFRNRRDAALRPALDSGRLQWSQIDSIASRILRNQLRFCAASKEAEPTKEVLFCQEHRDIAQEVARRSIVLLKNEHVEGSPVLPLSPNISSLAVIGRHADSPLTGDGASSWVDCPEVTTPLQSIREKLSRTKVYASASDSEAEGVAAASSAEIALVVVGYDGHDEGEYLRPSRERDATAFSIFPQPDGTPGSNRVQEARARAADAARKADSRAQAAQLSGSSSAPTSGSRPEGDLATRPTGGDRLSVRLRPQDVQLIRAVSAVNPRTVVSIITAGAVITEEWRHLVPSVLVSWYNGWANGTALIDILTGASNPSGRLPWSMPRAEAHLPPFQADVNHATYDKWFGQRRLDRMGVSAAYPLGYGISYTEFDLSDAQMVSGPNNQEGAAPQISVVATNTGKRAGRCVVQVYGCPDFGPGPHDFPDRVLVGFGNVFLEAKESKLLVVEISSQPLQRWREGEFRADAKTVTFEVGQHARDPTNLTLSTETPRAML